MLDNHYVPDGYGIISNFNIFGYKISTYTFFVGLGLLIGAGIVFIIGAVDGFVRPLKCN